jgi:UDP-3-O-[3-hydroxymyristoyl] glucosamine N-acyltransferase
MTLLLEKMFNCFPNRNCGCVIIEDEVTIWGQVGTASGVTIAKAMGQTVTKSVEGGKSYFGTPIEESREN